MEICVSKETIVSKCKNSDMGGLEDVNESYS